MTTTCQFLKNAIPFPFFLQPPMSRTLLNLFQNEYFHLPPCEGTFESSPLVEVPKWGRLWGRVQDLPAASPPELPAANDAAPGASAAVDLPASPLAAAPAPAADTAAAIYNALPTSTADVSGAAAPANSAVPSAKFPTRADISSGPLLRATAGSG